MYLILSNAFTATGLTDTYFKYRSWRELDGYPLIGEFATYSGGGYVAELGTDLTTALGVVERIRNGSWIDESTRAVFIEFNLYNVNMNLWGVSMYRLEFLTTGGKKSLQCLFKFTM